MTDIKIENKDIVINESGTPVVLENFDVIIQQIKLALAIKKGSFIYDRELGTSINEDIFIKENAKNTLEVLIAESLINVPDVSVEVKSIESKNDKIYGLLSISNGYENKEIEVIIFE